MDLNFSPALGSALSSQLERAARMTGLALEQLELLGQSSTAAREFVEAANRGEPDAFLAQVNWAHLESLLQVQHVRIRYGRYEGVVS